MELTKEEIAEIEKWLQKEAVSNVPLEAPVVASVSRLSASPVGVLLGGDARLSKSTQRLESRRASEEVRKKRAKEKRAAALPRGRFHHQRKAATARRAKEKRWREQPLKSLMFGYGSWAVTQEEWDRHIAPFWEKYEPKHLKVRLTRAKGTRQNPYTIYDIRLWHLKKKKMLWDGRDLAVWDFSQPNALDIEKAPEGAQLFERDVWLSRDKLRAKAHLEELNHMRRILEKKISRLQELSEGPQV